MRHRLFLTLACTVALFLGTAGTRADEAAKVWSGLVFACNEQGPLAPELEPYKVKLEHIFGYSHFCLIGQHTEAMDEPSEHWLVPGKTFSLQATSKHSPVGTGYVVHLRLFQERHMLVDTKVWLAPGNPLFIRGPLHAKGQVILILLVK